MPPPTCPVAVAPSRGEIAAVVIDRRRGTLGAARWAGARWTLAWAVLLPAGCADSTGPAFPHIELTDFAPSLGIDLDEMTRIDGGIYVLDLVEGSGEAIGTYQRVEVGYTLFLADGRLAASDDGYTYRTGCRETVPRGLESGVAGMKVGGQRRIIIPGRWGYGSDPPEGIDVPHGAILVFLVDAKSAARLPPNFAC